MAMNLRLDMLEMDVHSQRDSEERGEREREEEVGGGGGRRGSGGRRGGGGRQWD